MSNFLSIGDLSDIQAPRAAIPEGTYAVAFDGAEVGQSERGEYLVIRYRIARGEYEGYTWEDLLSGNTEVAPGRKMSGFDVTKRTLKGLLLALLPDEDVVNSFFRGCTSLSDVAAVLNTRLNGNGTFVATVSQEARLRDPSDPSKGRWPARNRIEPSGFVPARKAQS